MIKYFIQVFRKESISNNTMWFIKSIINGDSIELTPSIDNAMIFVENVLDYVINQLKSCPNVVGFVLITAIDR